MNVTLKGEDYRLIEVAQFPPQLSDFQEPLIKKGILYKTDRSVFDLKGRPWTFITHFEYKTGETVWCVNGDAIK